MRKVETERERMCAMFEHPLWRKTCLMEFYGCNVFRMTYCCRSCASRGHALWKRSPFQQSKVSYFECKLALCVGCVMQAITVHLPSTDSLIPSSKLLAYGESTYVYSCDAYTTTYQRTVHELFLPWGKVLAPLLPLLR
jgi:hypothetical protein